MEERVRALACALLVACFTQNMLSVEAQYFNNSMEAGNKWLAFVQPNITIVNRTDLQPSSGAPAGITSFTGG
eukprot:1518180-Pyramimonas_sp.AAC.1